MAEVTLGRVSAQALEELCVVLAGILPASKVPVGG